MKTISSFLFALLFVLCALPQLQAQMTEGKVRFGLKAGVSGSNLYDDATASEKQTRIGFTGGAFAKIPLGGARFSLRPEVLFTTKGAQFDIAGGNTSELKLSYIEIPLSLELNIAIINIHAGIHAGLLASSDGKFKDSQGNPITFDLNKEDLQSVDYGWHLGAGLDLGNLGLHFRISRGLQDIRKDDTLKEAFGSLKNASWSLTAAYGF